MKPSRSSFTLQHALLSIVVCVMVATNRMFVVTAQSDNSCTVCISGNEMRFPDLEICQEFPPQTNGMFKTDNDCKNLQLQSYQKGCCNNPPFDYCSYCEDGTSFNPDAIVPTGQFVGGLTCFDYGFSNSAMIGVFTDGECSDTFMRRAGHYCGCPGQEQECWLCPDGNPPNNPGKGDEWVTQSNCRGIEFLFSLLKKDECDAFPMDAGADLAIFCGCGGLNQTEIEFQQEIFKCELCRNEAFIVNPDKIYTDGSSFSKSCKDADNFARDVIKTPYACNNPNYFATAREVCCSDGGSSGASLVPSWVSMSLFVAGAMAAAFV
jgi:hypothetical protein